MRHKLFNTKDCLSPQLAMHILIKMICSQKVSPKLQFTFVQIIIQCLKVDPEAKLDLKYLSSLCFQEKNRPRRKKTTRKNESKKEKKSNLTSSTFLIASCPATQRLHNRRLLIKTQPYFQVAPIIFYCQQPNSRRKYSRLAI